MTQGTRREATWSGLARILAWLGLVAVTWWLLSMTLRTSDQISLGHIRISDPVRELNLQPFKNKVQPFRNLLTSSSPAVRRAARTYLFVDVLGNVAVFIPFGVALAAATIPDRPKGLRRRLWLWWLAVTGAGLVLSLFIEIAQLAIPSRVTDVDDVILNTLGTAVGALAVWAAVRFMDRAYS